MKTKTLNRSLLFLLLLVFTIKPAVNLCFHVFDVKSEVCELLEQDVEEEELDDLEENDQFIHFTLHHLSIFEQLSKARKVRGSGFHSEYDPAVVLPPPEHLYA